MRTCAALLTAAVLAPAPWFVATADDAQTCFGAGGSDSAGLTLGMTCSTPGGSGPSSGSTPAIYPIRCDDTSCQLNPVIQCPARDQQYVIYWATAEDGTQ